MFCVSRKLRVSVLWGGVSISPSSLYSKASARLLPLLNSDNISTDVMRPAALHTLRRSPHYTLAVETTVPPIPESLKPSFVDVPSATMNFSPCTQVLALVESSEASKLQETGASGYKSLQLADRLRCSSFTSVPLSSPAELRRQRRALTCPQLLVKAMTTKSTAIGSGAGQPADAPGNAAQLASLPLCELNKRSAQFGTWNVVVQQAQVSEESS